MFSAGVLEDFSSHVDWKGVAMAMPPLFDRQPHPAVFTTVGRPSTLSYTALSPTHTETRVHGFPFLFSPALSWQLFIPKTFPSEEMSACAHRQRSPRRSPCYNTAFFIIAIIIIIMSRHPHSAPHAHHQFLRYCRSQMRLVASGNLEHGKREYNEKMSSGLTG